MFELEFADLLKYYGFSSSPIPKLYHATVRYPELRQQVEDAQRNNDGQAVCCCVAEVIPACYTRNLQPGKVR